MNKVISEIKNKVFIDKNIQFWSLDEGKVNGKKCRVVGLLKRCDCALKGTKTIFLGLSGLRSR